MADIFGVDWSSGREHGGKSSLIQKIVDELRELSLNSPEGSCLGLESDLVERFGVSIPTFRHAAKIVEHDNWLSLRRGRNGGFYASRPQLRDVLEGPALFMKTQSATIEHVFELTRLILLSAAASAAVCDDVDLRNKLQAMHDDLAAPPSTPQTSADMRASARYLNRLVCEMSGNPALLLALDIAFAFGAYHPDHNLYEGRADRIKTYREYQYRLADAVLARDPDRAMLASFRISELLAGWLAEDRGNPRTPEIAAQQAAMLKFVTP